MKAKIIEISELELGDEIIFVLNDGTEAEAWHGIVDKLSEEEESNLLCFRTVKLTESNHSHHITEEDQIWLIHREEKKMSDQELSEYIRSIDWEEERTKMRQELYAARIELEKRGEIVIHNNE